MSMDKAIEKINTEMQKDPNNTYLEILGHYLIERCADEAAAAAILTDGKSLKGAVSAIEAEARKQKTGGVAVVSDNAAFGIVDQYFGLPVNQAARAEIQRQVDGKGAGPAARPASLVLAPAPASTAPLNFSLEDFL